MILAAALLAMGLLAPYVLRRAAGHMAPPLVVAAQLAGLVLAWLGVIDLVSVWAMPDHGLLGLCQAVLFAPHDLSELPGDVLLVTGGAALGGRGAYAMATTYRVVRRARQRIDSLGPQTVDGLTFVELGQVACTVGFVRSQILVDRARLAQLTPAQQRAVIAHERSHARRWHGAVNLVARGLAAGLAPSPGARVAYAEIRRHLEAAADDCAARHTSRRDVATAIIEAASPPPSALALGATGWTAWRVDRLLTPRPRLLRHAAIALALVALTGVAVAQLSGHAVIGVHLLPSPLPCCTG